MVSSAGLIRVIAVKLKEYKAEHIVVDPVMVSTSGSRLIAREAEAVLKEELIPMADILTPNIPEAQVLAGCNIESAEDMERAARIIGDACGCAVLLKGGHQLNDANDLLYHAGSFRWFAGKRIDNPNTHGTGCTLSSAIAANLAKGFSMEKSGAAGQGLYLRSPGGHAGSGARQRTYEPWVCHGRSVYGRGVKPGRMPNG